MQREFATIEKSQTKAVESKRACRNKKICLSLLVKTRRRHTCLFYFEKKKKKNRHKRASFVSHGSASRVD